jgi:hypothetical protein
MVMKSTAPYASGRAILATPCRGPSWTGDASSKLSLPPQISSRTMSASGSGSVAPLFGGSSAKGKGPATAGGAEQPAAYELPW